MLYIPFLFFLALTIYYWKKKQCIDVSVFLFAEYALTSFFSILCVNLSLLGEGGIHFTQMNLQLNAIPTLLYCTLIALVILPFTRLDIRKFSSIENQKAHLFDGVTYFLFAVALLNIYIVADNVIDTLQEGDFASTRSMHYAGETDTSKTENLPKILGYFHYFNRSTLLALPWFFYSICFLKKHWTYNVALFVASLSLPLYGIQNADRTEFIFYAQTFILSYILFKPYIYTPQKKFLKKLILPFTVFFIIYLSAVTIARFAERDAGASGGAIRYAGQSYLNFCYYYENANDEHIYTHRMFPLTNHILTNESYLNDIKNTQGDEQGFFVGVFPSFLGDFLLDTGVTGMIVWVMMFVTITFISFPTNKAPTISFGSILWYYVLATIPMFGIFYYPYFEFMQGIFLVLTVIIAISLHYKFKF